MEAIRTWRPDLVFLDVQMPRMSGLDVMQAIGAAAMPATVFVTAYDQYALNAFDAAAVDYLVKPFKDDRFVEAIRRARRRVESEGREGCTSGSWRSCTAARRRPLLHGSRPTRPCGTSSALRYRCTGRCASYRCRK